MLKVGQTCTYTKVIGEKDIQAFADLSGDYNPAHMDDDYAKESIFGQRVAHGMLSASYVSAVLGTKLPGPGTIYLHQDLDFLKPVYIGDEITAIVEIKKCTNQEKGIYECSTKCVNQNGDVVLDGSAVVKYIEPKEKYEPKKIENKTTFYSVEELAKLGIKKYGSNVLISRNAILYSPEKLEIGHDVRIDDFAIIGGNVKLGNYIHIAQFCGLYGSIGGIEMEDFTGLSSKCSVYATSDDYTGKSMTNPMVPEEFKPYSIEKKVTIKKHAIVGVNSVVLPGVEIAEGTSVGAMSVVNKSTEEWSIYVGSPAKKLKDRHKDILKLEKEFVESLK